MRKTTAWLFVTLDGVVESPEKWVLYNDEIAAAIDAHSEQADTLLLGRKTYDVFAASWPQRTTDDDPFADWMNNTPKVVASTTLRDPEWQNTTVIEGDVAAAVRELKAQDGKDILINGSGTLIRYLLEHRLLDELRLFVHPVLAGEGTRLFDGELASSLSLLESAACSNGVLNVVYGPGQNG